MGTRIFAADGTMKGYAKQPNVRLYDADGNAWDRNKGEKQYDLIVGVEWNQGTDTWTRIDSDGTEWSGLTRASFDDFYPWKGMRRVNLNVNGTIANVFGDAAYKEDGTNGRVMVQIPKFWIKSEETSANKYRWWVANYAASGFEVHPAFKQRVGGSVASPTGIIADYIYIGAYEADGYDDSGTFKAHSRSGKVPMTGGVSYTDMPNAGVLTIDYARTYGEAVGAGWGITNIWTRGSVFNFLVGIEYGNMDSQTELGRGVVDLISGVGFAGVNTGAHSVNDNLDANGTIKSTYAGAAGQANDGDYPVTWRWIENLWGNVWEFVDGYEAVDAAYHILKATGAWDNSGPSVWDSDDYDASAGAPIVADGYVSNILYEAALKYLLIAEAVVGSDATFIPDKFYAHDTGGTNILLAGGYWLMASAAGLCCLFSIAVASVSDRALGCRLEYIG